MRVPTPDIIMIPARSGSQRIPGKNLRILGDWQLIHWSIAFAHHTMPGQAIYVVTDIPKGLLNRKYCNCVIFFERTPSVSDNNASTESVALELLSRLLIRKGSILLLQPTSPFRSRGSLLQLFEIFNGSENAFSTCTDKESPNGNLYLAPINAILEGLTFSARSNSTVGSKHIWEDLDIDHEAQFREAEKIASQRRELFPYVTARWACSEPV